ncbi:hypothetical protein KCU93_g4848, partial [Aureobasidium melanogenum]
MFHGCSPDTMATFSQLPWEIQQDILDRLVVDRRSLTHNDRKNLLAPMRVNSFWFNHTADILWNNLSNLENTFAHMGFQDDRRQLYVSKIRILNLHTARIYFDLIESLKFESLTCLKLRGHHITILPFLQPNLKTFHFHSSFTLTRHELKQIAISCPNLCELHMLPLRTSNRSTPIVKTIPDPIDPETFSAFFQSCKNLNSLTLGEKLPSPMVLAAFIGIQPSVAAQLDELVLWNIEPGALPQESCKFLESCTSLLIGINHHETFHNGARFRPQPHDWQATPEDMRALSTLSTLKSISIRPMDINLTAPWMTDDYFGSWTSKFPDLRDLELDIECPVSWMAIVAFSKSHPLLRTCKLLWIQEVGNYNDLPSPEFVNLQHLKLNLVMGFDTSYIRDFVNKFIKHPGGISMQSLQLEARAQDPWRRSDLGPDQPRVTTVDAQAAVS